MDSAQQAAGCMCPQTRACPSRTSTVGTVTRVHWKTWKLFTTLVSLLREVAVGSAAWYVVLLPSFWFLSRLKSNSHQHIIEITSSMIFTQAVKHEHRRSGLLEHCKTSRKACPFGWPSEFCLTVSLCAEA